MSPFFRIVGAVVVLLGAARARLVGGRWLRVGAALASAMAAALAFWSAPALAAGYTYTGQLTGAPGEPFQNVTSAAVDDVTGDSLVADSGASPSAVVYVFNSSHSYVTTLTGSDTPAGNFGQGGSSSIAGLHVATNNTSGNIYVASAPQGVVDILDSAGAYVTQFAGAGTPQGSFAPQGSTPCIGGIAVDQLTGDVYVTDPCAGTVDVFNSDGSYLSQLTGANTLGGAFYEAGSVAVNSVTGDVFVGDTYTGWVYVFSSAGQYLSTLTGSSVPGDAGSLGGGVISDDTSGTIFAGSVDQPTQTRVIDQLDPSGTYAGRLTGTSATQQFSGPSVLGVDEATGNLMVADQDGEAVDFFTAPAPAAPQVARQYVGQVGTNGVTFYAQVNPGNRDTIYHFEYGPTSNYGTSVPVPDADLGSGVINQTVSQTVQGLTAGATYHYRVVATNSQGTADGPDQTFTTLQVSSGSQSCPNAQFRTGPAASLPDCRAYELVSPPGSRPYLQATTPGSAVANAQASPAGNELRWMSYYPIPGAESSGYYYLSTRTSSGWSTSGLIPPQSQQSAETSNCDPAMFLSADFSAGVLSDGYDTPQVWPSVGTCQSDDPQLVAGEPQGVENLFHWGAASGSYQLVDVTSTGAPPASAANAQFEGGSSDFSTVIFEDGTPLTPNAPSGTDVYAWSAGTTSLVSVLPDGTPATGAVVNGVAAVGSIFSDGSLSGAISDDASRVFFTSGGNLYVRENPTQPQSPLTGTTCTVATDACTVQVDASQAGGSGGGGQFQWASSDGSEVFFTDYASAGLTSDTVGGSGPNLYEYDVNTGQLTDLTPATTVQVQGVMGASSDGSYVYFVADGALTRTPNEQGNSPQVGQPNLYEYNGGPPTFIATLDTADSEDWSTASYLMARVSPNGQFLAFPSVNSLTGYDNTDASTGQADQEVFLFDASAGALSCVSCVATGAAPTGDAILGGTEALGDTDSPGYMQRNLLDDGRVFFTSPDQLVPAATNGQYNVYESEPNGVGSCTQPNGCLALISSGTSANGSFFYDASPNGNDVFFVTTQNLTSDDSDGLLQIYDARVDGGFPTAAAPAAPCATSANCEGVGSAPPAAPVAGTVSFTGPGNQGSTTTTAASKRTKGKVLVTRKTIRGDTFLLDVKVPAAGRITITGANVIKLTRSVRKAGTYKLTVALAARAKPQLRARRKLTVSLKVSYKPANGTNSTTTLTVDLKA